LSLVQEGLAQLQELSESGVTAPTPTPNPSATPTRTAAAPAAPPAPPSTTAATAGSVSTSSADVGSRLAASAAVAAPPIDRNLQILLPVASDIQLDASFFERTPAELKAEYARLAARRQAGEVLMTRAWREQQQQATAAKGAGRAVIVRVRFPEVRRSRFWGTGGWWTRMASIS